MDDHLICLSEEDATLISGVLEGLKQSCLPDQFQIELLERTMGDARVVAADLIPPDTVVIHCAIRVVDLQTGKKKRYTIVLPELADMAKRLLSVTAPLGIALLGHKQGEVVEANVPGGRRLLKIERVRHLPRRTEGFRSLPNQRTPQLSRIPPGDRMKSSIRVLALSLLFILVSTLAGIAQSSGTWTPTGGMSVGRYAMSAVLLPSGKVLVAGGASNGTILATAEVYDPTTGQWSPTDSMTTARRNYVAVVLSNGKVLVAGGCTNLDCSGATNTAEIYDPNGGTWTPTGAMSTLRYFFAATLLSSGQVLVEGGCSAINCYYDTASAEVYNPTTGKWSLIGNMSSSRDYHTATRMGDGRVLVVGGYTGGTITEIYGDHSVQPWSKAAPALYAQKLHTATLLPNGKVLVAGGIIGYLPGALCELYDPATKSWSATGSMITARALQGAVLLPNGKAMVAGGEAFRRPKYYKLASVELYDPSTGVWSATGNMTIERYQHAIVLLNNGRVLVVGGLSNPDVSLPSAELYTP